MLCLTTHLYVRMSAASATRLCQATDLKQISVHLRPSAAKGSYLLAPQWHPRCSEQQLPGSASLPSGPMQVCVRPHQNRPPPERGTVGSGSDQMYWLFQCSAEHRPGRSVLKRSEILLMLRLPLHLPLSEWPASLPRGRDGFLRCCGPGSSLCSGRLLQLRPPWPA